jgi:hypothetical protein
VLHVAKYTASSSPVKHEKRSVSAVRSLLKLERHRPEVPAATH